MSCLLAPYPMIIHLAHTAPQTVGYGCIYDEQIGKFSRVKVYARLEGVWEHPDKDGNMVVRLSAPETMTFIYEHGLGDGDARGIKGTV